MYLKVPWHRYMKENHLYDVVALHTRWNHDVFRFNGSTLQFIDQYVLIMICYSRLLGLESVFVSILRDPTDTFESLYTYGHLDEAFNMSLQTYIKRFSHI
jgi:hypothetical protein